MSTHEFTLVLDRTPTEEELDVLYEAGLDDSSLEYGAHHPALVHVARDAADLADAIFSAMNDVERAAFSVVAVRGEDLVTLKTIAVRTGRTYESVRRLANGSRGPGGFPVPESSDGWALYSWAQVSQWFAEHYGRPDDVSAYDRQIAAADHLVRARAILRDDPAMESLMRLAS